MKYLNRQVVKFLTISIMAVSATTAITSANAATAFNPYLGVWVGNVCQTPYGWQIVPPAPVGAGCYSPAYGVGFIADY